MMDIVDEMGISKVAENTVKYITPYQLAKYLKILVKIEIIMIAKKDDWLRIAVSNPTANGIESFLIDNGAGDSVTIYIKENTAFIKGFDHENIFSPYQQDDDGESFLNQVYLNGPTEFIELLDDESKYETTFAIWNLQGGDSWYLNKVSEENDGGREYLLGYIHTSPQSLIEWVKGYHEVSLDFDIISSIYEGNDITENMIVALNPNRDIKEVIEELDNMGKTVY